MLLGGGIEIVWTRICVCYYSTEKGGGEVRRLD